MKSSIKVGINRFNMEPVEVFEFNGGEVSIKLPYIPYGTRSSVNVEVQLQDSVGVVALLMVKEALDASLPKNIPINLWMGYVPYARQDRRCNEGEAFSIKVFANLVNSMKFNRVFVLDPHSDVTGALIDNLIIATQSSVISTSDRLTSQLLKGNLTLVSPDAGAAKKTQEVAKKFNGAEVIYASKERDTATGALSGFAYTGDVTGKELLIVDDIFDGGGTFAGLAKLLKEGGAGSITLYVSHGIFAKGLKVIDGLIDTVYTTNTLSRPENVTEGFTGQYFELNW